MLQKIIRIDSVGTLSWSAKADCDFKPLTLIYGQNGVGKTTLCAVFRSLWRNDPRYILERRRIGMSTIPSVQLLVDGRSVAFKDNVWTERCAGFSVFDPYFIDESVYQGRDVSIEQRRNLHSLAIGEQGVALARKVDDLDDKIREKMARSVS